MEISCHGGRLILHKILALAVEAGAKLAERGEFTRRAFLNGKIDLLKAEAVLDLIQAKSSAGLTVAAAQLGGSLSSRIALLRTGALELLTAIEAALDFPEDIADLGRGEADKRIDSLLQEIGALLASADDGRVIREGVRLAIVGRPNVGKSSLLNCLVENDRAIVSDLPGTTRDTIEECVVINGLAFVLVDTAGLRPAENKAEESGIGRTMTEIDRADMVVFVVDASTSLSTEDLKGISMTNPERAIIVMNKIDLGVCTDPGVGPQGRPTFFTSALSGAGIKKLKDGLVNFVLHGKELGPLGGGFINLRHKECLIRAREALARTQGALAANEPMDLIAIDLRHAIIALGEISGHQVSEEIVDQIFEKFCVGK